MLARRVATAAYGGDEAEGSGGRRIQLKAMPQQSAAEVHRGVLTYSRTAEEARLLNDLDRALAALDVPDSVATAIHRAADSSMPALSRTLLDLVNGVESGTTAYSPFEAITTAGVVTGVGVGLGAAARVGALAALPLAGLFWSPIGIAAGGAYAALRARRAYASSDAQARKRAVEVAVERAVALSDRVDELTSDSKLDRLVQALTSGEIGPATVLFADHPETFDYLATMLEDVGAIHTLSADDGDAASRLATLEAFQGGGLLLTQTLPMRGLEVSASDVVHYDIPPVRDALLSREARVRAPGEILRAWRLEAP